MNNLIQFHPLANLFPLLDGDEFSTLVEDIRAHSLREQIMLFEGAILDGRNRYRACISAGFDRRFEIYNGSDPLAYVISLNLKRRHLDESQRAMVAAKIATLPKGSNQHSPLGESSQVQAAQMMNVGKRSVERAAEVGANAIPELVEKVERGQVSVSAAASVSQLSEPEQRQIVAAGPKAVVEVASDIRENGMAHRTNFTGNNQWFTPSQYIEMARNVRGDIDLDPASHAVAQEIVKAARFFTQEDDGLKQKWAGRVWLNPPYSQPGETPQAGGTEGAPEPNAAPGERPVFDPWEKFIAPVFPLDVLPPVVADFVAWQSDVIGCDPSALAMACLATFSGALNHSITLKMMEHGGWEASPRLWVLLVGDLSTKKSPLINAALAPYRHHQDEVMAEYSAALREWEQEFGALAKGKDAPPKPPLPQRFIVNDTTVEKVGDILSRSGRGILVHADELAGWIGSMERYANNGKTSDRAFWLKSFDGGSYNIDRINRGELFISNLSASIIGGIQPERLAELGGLTSDGLLQQFIPVMMKNSQFTKDRPAATEQYDNLVADLIKCMPVMACFNSLTYKPVLLAPQALKAMDAIRERIFEIELNSDSISAGFQGFLGKLEGIAGSITLILHVVGNPQGGISRAVLAATVERAGRVIFEFLLPHALEFYQNRQGNSDGEKTRKIAAWILTHGQSNLSVRDFVRGPGFMRGMDELAVNKAVALMAVGWLEPVGKGPVYKKWVVAQSVFDQMAEELWLILGDGVNQAADLASGTTSIPSRNLTPSMTLGN